MARIETPDRSGSGESPLGPSHPFTMMRHAHATKLALCDRLEAIADSLPSGGSRFEREAVARAIAPLLESAHRFEEDVVFPYCAARSVGCLSIAASLERLRAEHREDTSYGEEVAEALLLIGARKPVPGAETVGFMLRGFFSALRRHIAFERDYIGMIVGQCG